MNGAVMNSTEERSYRDGAGEPDGYRLARRRRRRQQVRRRRLSALLFLGVFLAAVILAAMFLSGCGSGDTVGDAGPAVSVTTTAAGSDTTATTDADDPGTTTTQPGGSTGGSTVTTQANGQELSVLVYFARGEKLGVARRTIPYTKEVGAAAMKELLAGPNERERVEGELLTAIPQGTTFLGLNIKDGVATVDLSEEFASGGGSLSMMMRIGQVVYTLTQFPSVDRVSFRLDGEPASSIGGEGIIVDPPVGRADYESVTPAILVESPAVGDVVSSPMRIMGTSNVFEATHQVNIVDAEGLIIADEHVTATSGTGTRGTWDVTIPFEVDRPQRGALIVFTYSAKDGSQRDIVEIPLELRP